MEFSSALIIALNDILVCLLPIIFFKRGAFTPMWFITALPYGLAPLITFSVYYALLPPSWNYSPGLAHGGIALSALSIFMIGLAIGAHRIPLALWHQKPENDAPQHIVDWGIYRRIRHPFYSAFILLMIANTLVTQSIFALALLAYVATILTLTAKKEERRLSNEPGDIGAHYRNYLGSTGRFCPRLF